MCISELSDLVKQIHHEAGIVLHHWAGDRPEYNDYDDGESISGSNGKATYFRAVHGIKLHLCGTDWSNYPAGQNEHPLAIIYNYFHWSGANEVSCRERIDQVYVGVLHNPLPKKVIRTEKETKEFRIVKRQRTDFFGKLFGLTEEEKVSNKKVITREEPRPLSDYITTNCKDHVNLLMLSVPVCLPDNHGRCGRQPQVVLFATEQLVSDVENYLQANPQQYIDFFKGLFPAEKFPNVNKNILAQCYDFGEIRFADGTSLARLYEYGTTNLRSALPGITYDYATKRVKVE